MVPNGPGESKGYSGLTSRVTHARGQQWNGWEGESRLCAAMLGLEAPRGSAHAHQTRGLAKIISNNMYRVVRVAQLALWGFCQGFCKSCAAPRALYAREFH